ncbi:MAG: hypothetical protein J0L82_09130 [Deltaproteobacteria bacterium]|nr:hypothetical protein [Deltaproteobacteria bacterium]
MRFIAIIFFFISSSCWASFDFGIGASSITSGRPSPALALGAESTEWGVLFRSVGVQTTVYAQNAWTLGGYKKILNEPMGPFAVSAGAGLGATYMLRDYRDSPSASNETESDAIVGPQFLVKFQYGVFYLGFDTLLGLTSRFEQHITLNFQDVSHITVGMSL